MDTVELLRVGEAVLYTTLGVAALRMWWRDRTGSAAYLALAFIALAVVTTFGWARARYGIDDISWLADLNGTLLLAFAWLLAAFAWSFQGRRPPRWLQAAGIVQLVLAVTLFLLPPLGAAGQRTGLVRVFVLVALAAWLALVVAAAIRLWSADPRQRVVRARTRSMAVGAFTLGAVLAVSVTVPQTGWLAITLAIVMLLAGLLFAAGFAPPKPLRWWWRQLPAGEVSRLQTALIAAATPREVAAAIVPAVAEVYGAGAVFLDGNGEVLASAGGDEEGLRCLVDRLGEDGGNRRVRVVPAAGYRLVVETSPYAPVFDEFEEGLLEQFRLQFGLALQRAQLYAAHESARSELQRAYDDQQAMLIGLAHDLRSPTVTIASYSALLQDADDLDEARAMAADLGRSAGYLDRLVDGISELSRIGRRDGDPEPVALEEVVVRAASRLAATHPRMRVEVEGQLPILLTDRLRVEQVIDNLLGNAAKHAGREDVTVRISSRQTAHGVRVVVADDGRGVPESEHELVFGLFRRGSGTDQAGSGVGLGLVRRIVESFGGQIRLVPASVGARFEIDLPAAVVPASPRMPVSEAGTPSSTSREP